MWLFSGSIDETRFWNKALYSYEIQSYYNCIVANNADGLLANYHYNQGIANANNAAVTALADTSINNNNGTLLNFALASTTSNWIAPGAITTTIACTGLPVQQFQLNGTGAQDWQGGYCYRLTNDIGQFGSMWHKEKCDLSQDFDITANLNFGTIDGLGADGITFSFQNVCISSGVGGQGIGISGISPSFIVEFDTYQNTNYGDPGYDHLAICKNGDLNHGGANSLIAPVGIVAGNANVEDGNDYLVRILWTHADNTLKVYVNNVLRTTYTGDIVSSIFLEMPKFIGVSLRRQVDTAMCKKFA